MPRFRNDTRRRGLDRFRTASDYRNGDEATALSVDLETAEMDDLRQRGVVALDGRWRTLACCA